MVHHKRIVTLAMTASLALGISGLSAQDPEPTKKRRRPPEEMTKEEHYKAQQKASRVHGVEVHVKKMLALAMELREGGFEEEAQVLIHQAKRLAHKSHRPPRAVETIREGETRAVARAPFPARVPVLIEVEESPKARVRLDALRAEERARAQAEHKRIRQVKEDMVRRDRARAETVQRERDLDRRVENLSRQVRDLREMIQELKHALQRRQEEDRHTRRWPRTR